MKKLLIVSLAAVALGASTSAFAQVAGSVGTAPKAPVTKASKKAVRMPAAERKEIKEEVLAKLNLTADQKAKITAHEEASAAKIATLKQQAKADKKAGTVGTAKEDLKAVEKENKAFMKQILTKDQLKEMKLLRRQAIKDYEAKNGTTPVKP